MRELKSMLGESEAKGRHNAWLAGSLKLHAYIDGIRFERRAYRAYRPQRTLGLKCASHNVRTEGRSVATH